MKSIVGDKLYQSIKTNRAADDIPSRAKSKGSKALLPEGRGGRHDVDGIGGPHDKLFMYDRGGGNTLLYSNRAVPRMVRRLKKKKKRPWLGPQSSKRPHRYMCS